MPIVDARLEAGRAALAREEYGVLDTRGFAIATVQRIGYQLDQVDPARSLEDNRKWITGAEAHMNILRSEIRQLRRTVKAVHDRKEQHQNGVFKA